MANTASARKRIRQTQKRTARNQARKSRMRTFIKKVETAIASGDKGAAALLDYLARPAEDTVLLISLPKLDGSTQKTKWAKALIEGKDVQFLQIWPVDAAQLPQGIRQRLAQVVLSADQEAGELIAAPEAGLVARIGGEEFALLVPAETDAAALVARIGDSRAASRQQTVFHQHRMQCQRAKPGAGTGQEISPRTEAAISRHRETRWC